jgi:hypothetical protein
VLRKKGFYEGALDRDFGKRTFRAVCAFQRYSFGRNGADGAVGSVTASTLGIEWPTMRIGVNRNLRGNTQAIHRTIRRLRVVKPAPRVVV